MVDHHLNSMSTYSLSELLELVEQDAWEMVTERCRRDVLEMGLSRAQVKQILMQLKSSDFRKAQPQMYTDWGDVDADDFKMWCDLDDCVRCERGEGVELYIKMGEHTDDDGSACALISFHRSIKMWL
jgi:hypothetical protein